MTNEMIIKKMEKMIEIMNTCIKDARKDGESEEYIQRLCGERTGYQNVLEMLLNN